MGLDPEMRKKLSCIRIKTYADALNRFFDYEKQMEDQLAARVRERSQQFLERQDPTKRPTLSPPNQTSFRPSTGSAAVPTAVRPPIVDPKGEWYVSNKYVWLHQQVLVRVPTDVIPAVNGVILGRVAQNTHQQG